MFNPKQALQKIRKQKIFQQQETSILKHSQYDQPLFPQSVQPQHQPQIHSTLQSQTKIATFHNKPSTDPLQDRMTKLESLVFSLNEKLTQSNETISQLKMENNQLQTQLLKLTHQNNSLKSAQQSSSRNNLLQKTSFNNENNKVLTSLSNQKIQLKKAESKVIEEEVLSPEVQDVMEGIKKQAIQNILKRKQHNFRALKNASKEVLQKGQKALRELANIQKEYGKNYKKATLIINLEDADFE